MSEAPDPREREDCPSADACKASCDQHGWTCGGCGSIDCAHAEGWSLTDAAWCPKCRWLR